MLKRILAIAGIALFVALSFAAYEFYSFANHRDGQAESAAKETTAALGDQISQLLDRVAAEGARMAELFGKNDFSAAEVRALIKKSALNMPELQGVTAAFEPFAFNDDTRLFAPYYNKATQAFVQCEESYDYTDASVEGTAWYTQVRDNGQQWVEPYFGQAAQDWYIDLGVPFRYQSGSNKGKVRGTITMSFVCRDFGGFIHRLSLGKTGYGFLTSSEGTFLAHPNQAFVGKKKLADWRQPRLEQPAIANAFDDILAGKTGFVQFFDAKANDEMLFCYDQIPASKWGLGVAFFRNDLLGDQSSVRRRYINLAVLGSMLFVCLLAIVFSLDHLDENEIWRLSLISTALLLANVFFVSWLEHNSERPTKQNASYPIVDFTALNQFVDQHVAKADELKIQPPVPIPTGIQIQRLDFQDSYNLNVGGSVWQKIPAEHQQTIKPGFIFPQISPFAEASYIEETYREEIEAQEGQDGYLLVGWDFRVTLQLNFDYADFPFDKRLIDIEITPADAERSVLLVPDLDSYRYTIPSKRLGMNKSIVLSGNEITESYFNFSTEDSETYFGYGPRRHQRQASTLHFNVHLRRNLLNVFVTYLIPIVVALLMIFILLFASRKTSERQGIIESMAAFIFVLIFSHIDLRKEVVTGDLIYLEYFYFITYGMVLLSTFNLMAYTLDKTKLFDFNENQIFKAMYFPLFLLCVLIVTLVKFY